MTKPFLEEIADYVFEQYGDQTGDICLVTPNRRAGLFFRKYFSRRVVKPVWAPEVLSIEDFINRISGMKVCDSTSILFAFFELYCDLEKDMAQDIDEFSLWAPVLLNDFDEIDANLVDTQSLFDYLHDIKRIETWNPDGTPLTDFQKKYLSFFSKLKAWHHHLAEYLIKSNMAYQGMSSKKAASKVEADSYILPWQKALFVGFNALNRSEEVIIKTLLGRGQAEYLPDSDPYYTNDPDHEAGLFIRKYHKKFGHIINNDRTYITSLKKQITILGIAKNVNQARLAGNILQQRKEIRPDINTAIVLANEQLLIPTLNALPEDAESINVTMGYPLSKTNIFGFFDALWKLQLNATIPEKDSSNSGICFYHKDLIRFLNHSTSALLWDGDGGEDVTASVIQQIKQSNKAFLCVEELSRYFEISKAAIDPLSFLKLSWNNNKDDIFHSLLNLVGRLDQAFRDRAATQAKDILNTPYFIDFEALYFFSTLFRRLNSFMHRYPFIKSLQTIYKLFKQLTLETSLAFSGEPLQGMQVMGMLETRSLDFKHIILLSANENVLPRPKTNSSFLPFDIKKKFGLQVHNDKDAIYAYHFYRLLQRAENIYLIYNTQSEDIGSNEKSRFITQLQMELPGRAPNINITEQIIALPPPAVAKQHDYDIFKNKDISDRLVTMSRNGLSPSALNTYINCSLQFYFTRVARLEEPVSMEETLESATMGTVVHGILETLYRPFVGEFLGVHDVEAMRKQTDEVTRRLFEKHYPKGNVSAGKNLLLFNLAKRYTSNFLKAETDYLKAIEGHSIKVLTLEEELEGTIDVMVNGSPVTIMIRGKADRIDQVGQTIRVVDYKTGKIKRNELKFPDWNLVTTDGRYGKAFQLLSYAWLYSRKYPKSSQIEPGIFSLRETKRGLQTLNTPEGVSILMHGHLQLFAKQLSALISNILDEQIPFRQTANEDNCTYCPFKVYCRRF
jgi:ATP-dependent helicase/nuclease subunit B